MVPDDNFEDVLAIATALGDGESDSSNDENQRQRLLDLASPTKDRNEILVCGCG